MSWSGGPGPCLLDPQIREADVQWVERNADVWKAREDTVGGTIAN